MLFSKAKSIIGLDIGSSCVKLVEVSEAKRGYHLEGLGIAPLPTEAIVDGALLNSQAIVDAIRSLVYQNKVKTKDVATSVAGHSVIIKKVSMPSMTRAELEQSIQYEAEQYIPFDVNDVNLDFQIIEEPFEGEGKMEILLVAVKKDMINDYVNVISAAGLNPIVVDVDAFAVENAYEVNYEHDPEDRVALVDIGSSVITINIIKNGVPLFTRDVSSGGGQYNEEIQKSFGMSFEQAEEAKMGVVAEGNEAPPPHELEKIIHSVSDLLAIEIQKSIEFYSSTSRGDAVSRILLSGGASRMGGLADAIKDRTGVTLELLDPFRNLIFNQRRFDPEYIRDMGPAMAVSVGLALRKAGDQ